MEDLLMLLKDFSYLVAVKRDFIGDGLHLHLMGFYALPTYKMFKYL